MKKYIRSSTSSARKSTSVKITAACEGQALFSLENLAELLQQLPQLSNYRIGLGTSPNGHPQFAIGDTVYNCLWENLQTPLPTIPDTPTL